MHLNFKYYYCFFFLIVHFFLFSQNKESSLFEKKILQQKTIEFKDEIDFVKAHSFYSKKEWDSTLVYSMRQLSNGNKASADYCHYFRGISFFNKRLYKEAQKELLLVSNTFPLLAIKNFTLGVSLLESKDFYKALYYFKKSENQFKKLK
jgi:hypothetical protein